MKYGDSEVFILGELVRYVESLREAVAVWQKGGGAPHLAFVKDLRKVDSLLANLISFHSVTIFLFFH